MDTKNFIGWTVVILHFPLMIVGFVGGFLLGSFMGGVHLYQALMDKL